MGLFLCEACVLVAVVSDKNDILMVSVLDQKHDFVLRDEYKRLQAYYEMST